MTFRPLELGDIRKSELPEGTRISFIGRNNFTEEVEILELKWPPKETEYENPITKKKNYEFAFQKKHDNTDVKYIVFDEYGRNLNSQQDENSVRNTLSGIYIFVPSRKGGRRTRRTRRTTRINKKLRRNQKSRIIRKRRY
jgi:hypothetical protein